MTLTVHDVAGNVTSTTHPVTVVGPPPPGAPGTSTGSHRAPVPPRARDRARARAPEAPARPPLPAPVAAYAVVSKSLRKATRSGLVIRYSVNEQVAGRFDVLLSRTLAHRLGISGTPAVGLPTGTPAQLVIAKAFIVTTKGGRSTREDPVPEAHRPAPRQAPQGVADAATGGP